MSYTINPNAKNKWARNAENTMDLSLETDASSVYLDNGRTLEQEIGEGSMVSNVAIVDTSMSKIIDGTLDGAYESLVFKGKSLVNLVEKPTSANVGNGGKWNGYGGGNPSKTFITNGIRLANTQHGSIVLDYFDLSLFKPNTKYTLFIDVYHNGKGNPPVLDKIAGTGQYAIPLKNGHNCIVFTTIPDLTVANMGIRFGYAGSTSESCVYEFSNIVIVEGDHSSINPDYFTGLCDVKMPILRNVGKNLFNPTVPTPHHMVCNGATDGGLVGVIPVKPNTTYTLSVKKDTTKGRFVAKMSNRLLTLQDVNSFSQSSIYNYLRDNYANGRKFEYTINNQKSLTFTTLNDCHYIYVNVDRSFGTTTANEILVFSEMTLEESPTQTIYEPYKTNILRTSEEIVLREVKGVQDTYNPLTGEYIKRTGEIVLNGSQQVMRDGSLLFFALKDVPENNFSISDRLPSITVSQIVNGVTGVGVQDRGTGGRLYINIGDLNTEEEITQYLQNTPVTVQYKLVKPVTSIIESLTTPFAYENGHIILESGYEGQSLLPTLEYSTVINKTGLVENVAKTIQRQEKQLTMLEKMLIQNIINLDYNNTLLTLKNEMEEML